MVHFLVLWLLGQMLGLSLGTLLVEGQWAYLFAIAGGIIFAVLSFMVVHALPDLNETKNDGLDEWQ